MVPRSGCPGPRAPSALMLPPQLPQVPQLPAVRPPLAGRSSAGRHRDARARGSSVLRGLAEVIAYTWATTRVVRNRLTHILTGNGPSSVVYILSLALVAPVYVHKGSRIIVDEAMTTAAAAASAVIEEAGLGASRAVQVAGYALAVASLLVCSFALWHLGKRLLNRLAHMSHGNTALIQLVDSEAIYEISGLLLLLLLLLLRRRYYYYYYYYYYYIKLYYYMIILLFYYYYTNTITTI